MKYTRGKNPKSRNGFKRIYQLDEYYFDELSPESCYWAGFIAADGNIAQNKKQLTITLQARDKEQLEKLNTALRSTYAVRSGYSHGFPICSLVVSSEKLCLSLANNFNITPQKSLTLLPPKVTNSHLQDCFIKGYIDGDGSIGIYKRGNTQKDRLSISFIGTLEMCQWITDRFSAVLGKKAPNIRKSQKSLKNTWTTGVRDLSARILFEHYYNIPLGMKRKWKDEYHEYCENWRTKRFHNNLYEEIYELSKTKTRREIADARGCTPENIFWITSSSNFKQYVVEHGDPNFTPHLEKVRGRKCSIESCERKHYGRGYCELHHNRIIRSPKRYPKAHETKAVDLEGINSE